jgi:hypothetical protein
MASRSFEKLVLPDRIELSTSPLPMECSTTELRQHAGCGNQPKGPHQGGPILATRPPPAQARDRPPAPSKSDKIGAGCQLIAAGSPVAGRSGSHFLAQCGQRLDRADHHFEFDHFAGRMEFDEIDALELRFADISGKFWCGMVYPSARAILKALHTRTGPR